jgi:hypothetical protein
MNFRHDLSEDKKCLILHLLMTHKDDKQNINYSFPFSTKPTLAETFTTFTTTMRQYTREPRTDVVSMNGLYRIAGH